MPPVGDSFSQIATAVRRTDLIEWVRIHNKEAGAFAAFRSRLRSASKLVEFMRRNFVALH
jgi:hypothetical protein